MSLRGVKSKPLPGDFINSSGCVGGQNIHSENPGRKRPCFTQETEKLYGKEMQGTWPWLNHKGPVE